MTSDLADTTIHSFPHAFINRRGEAILVRTLESTRHSQLVDMYLAYEPRNSFSGLPPITDEACMRWVVDMIAHAVNLVALSFEKGLVGHAALFAIDDMSCEILVVVAPAQQRTGIGTELTRCLIQLSHELHFEGIRLNVEAGNHIARHVYEKCGFHYTSRGLVAELDMSLDLESYHSALLVPVHEIMNRNVVSIGLETPCQEALRLFLEDGVAALPVVDERNRLKGILSETDLLVEANLAKRVGEVLTREVVSVQEGCPLDNVISLFRSRKLRCIPVLDRRMRLVGTIRRRDVLAHYRKRM